MHSRVWLGGMLLGVLGVVLTFSTLLPPLGDSILLGSSIGLIIIGPIGGVALLPGTPQSPLPALSEEARLKSLVDSRETQTRRERETALGNFDRLLEGMERMDDPTVNTRLSRNFDRLLSKMTVHYPQWDSEGRIRTYVLMNKISENITPGNADACLDLVYRTLVTRGGEATEMSRLTLVRKVERMYLDPASRWPRHIAGALLLMNREDDAYAKGLVIDAIHMWSEERFVTLLPDFTAVRGMPKAARYEVEDLLQKEMGKARRAGDAPAVMRAKEILDTIVSAHAAQATVWNVAA